MTEQELESAKQRAAWRASLGLGVDEKVQEEIDEADADETNQGNLSGVGGTGGGTGGGNNLGTKSKESASLRSELGVSYFDPTEGTAAEYAYDPHLAEGYPYGSGAPYTEPLYPGSQEKRVVHGGGLDPDVDPYAYEGETPLAGGSADPSYRAGLFSEDVDARRAAYNEAKSLHDKAIDVQRKIERGERVSVEDSRLYGQIGDLRERMLEAQKSIEQIGPIDPTEPGVSGEQEESRAARFSGLFEAELGESDPETGLSGIGREEAIYNVTSKIRELNDQYREIGKSIAETKAARDRLKRDARQYSGARAGRQRSTLQNIQNQISFLYDQNEKMTDKLRENRKDREYLTYQLRRHYGYFE